MSINSRLHHRNAEYFVSRGPGNQNGALRSSVASVRGKTDRKHPTRILGSNVILDSRRFGEQTPHLPALFQSTTRALGLGRPAPRRRGGADPIEFFFVPMAAALSRPLPNTHCRVISGIR